MNLLNFFQSVIKNSYPVHGGDINKAWFVETREGKFFLKVNDADQYPQMLEKEARALAFFKKATTIKIPAVVEQGIKEGRQFLILEWLTATVVTAKGWERFGRGVGEMHKQTRDTFGWEEDNYIGSLLQVNPAYSGWPEFFYHCRILPLARKLQQSGVFDLADIRGIEKLFSGIDKIFPVEPPSLLHGDLWAGNFMFTGHGPSIFDPAAYYGHREMDIGMSLLFGGFDGRFYDAYNDTYPLEKHWKERIRYTQLYPLLVHAVLFGGGYVARCRDMIRVPT